ncbi:MAG: glycosyltransferase family A protein [Roseburia inulinivorans]
MVNSDIEIIIINNGMSNENYIKIQKWLYSEPNLRLYNTPKHLSYAESLNCGIDLAKGNYITFSDSHDWYEKDNNSLIDWQKFALEKSLKFAYAIL